MWVGSFVPSLSSASRCANGHSHALISLFDKQNIKDNGAVCKVGHVLSCGWLDIAELQLLTAPSEN